MPIMSISIVVLSTFTGTWIAYRYGLRVSSDDERRAVA